VTRLDIAGAVTDSIADQVAFPEIDVRHRASSRTRGAVYVHVEARTLDMTESVSCPTFRGPAVAAGYLGSVARARSGSTT